MERVVLHLTSLDSFLSEIGFNYGFNKMLCIRYCSACYIYSCCYINWFTLTVAHTIDQNDHSTKAMAHQNLEQVHEPWLEPVSNGY